MYNRWAFIFGVTSSSELLFYQDCSNNFPTVIIAPPGGHLILHRLTIRKLLLIGLSICTRISDLYFVKAQYQIEQA